MTKDTITRQTALDQLDYPDWETAVSRIQERIDERIRERTKVRASDDEGEPNDEFLDTVAIHGYAVIVADRFHSELLCNPMWLDLYAVLHEQVEATGLIDEYVHLEGIMDRGTMTIEGKTVRQYKLYIWS